MTGAAQDIGRTVALRRAEEGGSIALVDRSGLLAGVRHEAEASGARAFAIAVDLEIYAARYDSVHGAD